MNGMVFHVIPFNEIDERLKRLQKDRLWLATVTRRSEGSIRAALAPNSAPKNRTKLLQKALSDAIEAEEERQRAKQIPPGHVEVILSERQLKKVEEAASIAGYRHITDFCRVAIEEAADRLMEEETRTVKRARPQTEEAPFDPIKMALDAEANHQHQMKKRGGVKETTP